MGWLRVVVREKEREVKWIEGRWMKTKIGTWEAELRFIIGRLVSHHSSHCFVA